MHLTLEQINSADLDAAKKVIGAYEEAFPEKERYPFYLLMKGVENDSARLYAFYDEDIFVGFIYMIPRETQVFIFYFATCRNLRSKGYGSAILTLLSSLDECRGKAFVLNSETPKANENTNEEVQKRRRIAFYKRNGFESVGWQLNDSVSGVLFTVLCRGVFDAAAYSRLLASLGPEYGFNPKDLTQVMKT